MGEQGQRNRHTLIVIRGNEHGDGLIFGRGDVDHVVSSRYVGCADSLNVWDFKWRHDPIDLPTANRNQRIGTVEHHDFLPGFDWSRRAPWRGTYY